MTIYVSDTIQATAAPVTANPVSSRSWQWNKNGAPIEGATSSSYQVVDADEGASIDVTQIESNIVGTAKATSNALGPVVPFEPIALYKNNTIGAWYDPSDLTTMFQDAAGTTPVTAVEQPVGLILDKSKELILGPELVSNGDFSNGTTGWSAGPNTVISSGAAVSTATPPGSNIMQQSAFQPGAGKWVKLSFTVSGWTAGDLLVFINNDQIVVTGKNGTAEAYIYSRSSSGSGLLFRATNSAFTGALDNISVKELPGNHAAQTTSTSRPVLSARYNLLTKTEQFDAAVWTKTNATVTANAAVAPDGTMTADRLVTGGVASTLKSVNQSFSAAAATYILSIYVKDNGGIARSIDVFFATTGLSATVGTNYNFDTDTLTNYPAAGPFTLVSSSRTFVGNGWYRIGITIAVSSAQSILIYTSAPYQTAQIGDYYIWGASLVPANQSSLPYQRVNTSTDYDSDPTKFPSYLRFDGVDDFLVTNTIDFTSTDKMTVFAGVRKLSDAAIGVVVEFGAEYWASNGFTLQAPSQSSGAGATSPFSNYSTAVSDNTGTMASDFDVYLSQNLYAAPITNVVTGVYNRGAVPLSKALLRVNAAVAPRQSGNSFTGTDVTSNFLSAPLYIGRRGGTSLPFNGHIYGLIVRGAQTNSLQIEKTEEWLANKTGITI